jgi:hypothetical protein
VRELPCWNVLELRSTCLYKLRIRHLLCRFRVV